MKKIEMVDLKGQYKYIKDQVNQSVRKLLIYSVYKWPQVKSFQEHLVRHLSVKHVFLVLMERMHFRLP